MEVFSSPRWVYLSDLFVFLRMYPPFEPIQSFSIQEEAAGKHPVVVGLCQLQRPELVLEKEEVFLCL